MSIRFSSLLENKKESPFGILNDFFLIIGFPSHLYHACITLNFNLEVDMI